MRTLSSPVNALPFVCALTARRLQHKQYENECDMHMKDKEADGKLTLACLIPRFKWAAVVADGVPIPVYGDRLTRLRARALTLPLSQQRSCSRVLECRESLSAESSAVY